MTRTEFVVEDVFKFADGSTAFVGGQAESFVAVGRVCSCDLYRDGQLLQTVTVNCERIPNHVTGQASEIQSVVMTRDPVPITRADVVTHEYRLAATAQGAGSVRPSDHAVS